MQCKFVEKICYNSADVKLSELIVYCWNPESFQTVQNSVEMCVLFIAIGTSNLSKAHETRESL